MHSAEPNWDQVVRKLGPDLYKYFQARHDKSISDDLTQECFLRLYQHYHAGRWDPTLGSLRMFAYGIARLVHLESVRSKKFVDFDPDTLASEGSVETDLNQKMQARVVKQALLQLTSIQQECLLFIMDDELSVDEIANLLSTPANTVKSHIHRAKEKLREILSPLMEDL